MSSETSKESDNNPSDNEETSPFSFVETSFPSQRVTRATRRQARSQLPETSAQGIPSVIPKVETVQSQQQEATDQGIPSDIPTTEAVTSEVTLNPIQLFKSIGAPTAIKSITTMSNFKVRTTKKNVSNTDRVLFKRNERKNLDEDKRNALFKDATKTQHQKFSYVNIKNTSDDVLEDSYNIDMIVDKMRSSHIKYDMHTVFKVVHPVPVVQGGVDTGELQKNANGEVMTTDLYNEYSTLTSEQVAASNRWYNEWADDETHSENLNLTEEYFSSNCDYDLHDKVMENLKLADIAEKGGPLFFIFMMRQLLSNSREAAKNLETKIATFKVSKVKGEDISQVVSHLKGALQRLIHMKQYNIKNPAHEEFFRNMHGRLLEVFQTTSVAQFNGLFHMYASNIKLDALRNQTRPFDPKSVPNPFDVFAIAEGQYLELLEDDKWNGVNNLGGDSVFMADDEAGDVGTVATKLAI